MNNRGLSLVETLLYLSIMSVLVVAILGFSTRLSLARLKNQSLEEIQQNARYSLARLATDFYQAQNIASDSTAKSLHLQNSGGDLYYIFSEAGIYRQENSDPAVVLTSDRVIITNLAFNKVGDESLKIELTLQDYRYGKRPEFNNQLSISTALTLRQ